MSISSFSQSESSRSCLIDRLQNRIRKLETASRIDGGSCVSSGCAAIDRLLPEGGYPRGALVQWLTAGGQGANYLSLLAAKKACEDGGALVVVDSQNQFYPPAAAAIGIDLDHLIILRADSMGAKKTGSNSQATDPLVLSDDLLWCIDQSLRCSAVAAVWGRLGHIDERWFRRFQLSAESSGCLGLLVQPIRESGQPSWAEAQWWVSQVQAPQSSLQKSSLQTQTVRLQLTRSRSTTTGKSVNLSINTITGSVQPVRHKHEQSPTDPLSLVSQLGHSAMGHQRA